MATQTRAKIVRGQLRTMQKSVLNGGYCRGSEVQEGNPDRGTVLIAAAV